MEVLERTGHSDGWQLTAAGQRLRRIYHESDLLLSIALGEGLFDGLDASETAALASCVTYEHRSKEPPPPPSLPTPLLRARFKALEEIVDRLNRVERAASLPETRPPDAGFADAAWAWANGRPLHAVVDEDQTGGDFVRNCRLLVDLLPQLAQLADEDATVLACREAAYAVRRGVVTAGGGPS
jgi:ATP-dependent RNA helicase HelY